MIYYDHYISEPEIYHFFPELTLAISIIVVVLAFLGFILEGIERFPLSIYALKTNENITKKYDLKKLIGYRVDIFTKIYRLFKYKIR